MKSTRQILADQKGAYFLLSAIVLGAMVGFAALGVEIGRWYGIQAEISKSIDGAAFAGAKNVSNPKFPTDADLDAFVVEVAQANFPPGLLDTDTPVFVSNTDADGKVTVNGTVNSLNHLTTTFETGTPTTALGSVGSAKLRKAEVALVLDVSGSMGGGPLDDLKDGADTFVNNFENFQADHRFGLIKFAAGIETPFPLDHNFIANGMLGEISGLNATGGTNMESALAQARALSWSPAQLALPVNERTRQVVVFFSDGEPTTFRGDFTYNGGPIDGVASIYTGLGNVFPRIRRHDIQNQNLSPNITVARKTGDGKPSGSSVCGTTTVKWHIFSDTTYGLAQFPPTATLLPEQCNIAGGGGGSPFKNYVDWVAKEKTKANAQDLKNDGVEIFTIGLGGVTGADKDFMEGLATDPDHAFFSNDSSDLEGIFQSIANHLKLVLIS